MTKKQALPYIRRLYPIGGWVGPRTGLDAQCIIFLMKHREGKFKLLVISGIVYIIHKCVLIFRDL